MKQQIIIIIGVLVLINLIGAVDIFAGNNYSFQSEQFEYYNVVGNSSNMDGMNITWEDGNTTISFDIRYKSDNFTLILFNAGDEVIVEVPVSSGGGGGGGTRTVYKDREVKEYILFEGEGEVEEKIITETEIVTETIIETKTPFWAWFVVCVLIFLVIYIFIITVRE